MVFIKKNHGNAFFTNKIDKNGIGTMSIYEK